VTSVIAAHPEAASDESTALWKDADALFVEADELVEQLQRELQTDLDELERPPTASALVLSVHISGRLERRNTNIIEVGIIRVPLSLAEFKLFVRLAAARFESDDGFAFKGRMRSGGGLAEEGYYSPAGMDQAISRLRKPFRSLPGVRAEELIEVVNGRVRLSLDRDSLSWNADALARHPDAKIRALTDRLENGKRLQGG